MTAIRFYIDGDRVGPLFKRGTVRQGDRVRKAARDTAQDIANQIVVLGRGDISRAGDFGSRWLEGLAADVTEGGGNIRINVTHDVPYWSVFEYGKVIHGKPMLWIPLSFAKITEGIWARDYPDPLFRVDRKAGGAPLLLSSVDKQPKFFGKESVTIKKKFHLTEIARAAAQRMRDVYRSHLTQDFGP